MSNAYVGFDHTELVELTTMDASSLPEYKIHPDDAELDDEPTLFEEMMNANIEDDSDKESDSDDESEEEGIRELSAAERKKQELQNARKKAASAAGDDSDSDSDVEEVHAD